MKSRLFVGLAPLLLALAAAPSRAEGPAFDRIVLDDNFPGAYQVEVADVNGDGRPDVVAVGGGTCAWYENPTWKKRIVTTPRQSPGIISSATADLDGDGKAEVAVAYEFAMNEPTKGKLLLATQGKTIDDLWETTPITDIGSIHRLRWGMFNDLNRMQLEVTEKAVKPILEKKRALVVAPIFGEEAKPPVFDQDPAVPLLLFPADPPKSRPWRRFKVGQAHVLHAIDVIDFDGDGVSNVLGASNRGVTVFDAGWFTAGAPHYSPRDLVAGAPGEAPKKGCSEVHVGKLKDGRRFLATVEPWHGTDVAVYLAEDKAFSRFGPRNVIDDSIREGHALWVADVDGDGDDEVFAGFRGPGTSVRVYDFDGKGWNRSTVDDKIAAQDLRGGDLDGDGTPDVVAVGGSTKNVVWYRPKKTR